MKISRIPRNRCLALLAASGVCAAAANPSLTIYNQNFAVVRDTLALNLAAGENDVHDAGVTAQLEPDSVILRDPSGRHDLQILEQNYRHDPVTQELLLSLFEGQTIEFQPPDSPGRPAGPRLIRGKVVRSGYVPGGDAAQPVIEVDGRLQFSLPGTPLFPSLGDDTILKPTLNWRLATDRPGAFAAEVGYVTEGLNWSATYNLVSPETGDDVDLTGWITMENHSGTTFTNAAIQLMAGNVNKLEPMMAGIGSRMMPEAVFQANGMSAPVTEHAFDEFHLYTLARPATLHDQETKQVQFVQADGIHAPTLYVYDGAPGWGFHGGLNLEPDRQRSGSQILVQREFVNADTNHLGLALPAGKLRFYRRDAAGRLQFVGENTIDHTPRDETIRVTTGRAFDLVGERRQTAFHVDNDHKLLDESFAITLRNHKPDAAVTVTVIEHLDRWSNWTITAHSADFTQTDSQTIRFQVRVPPDGSQALTYTVHYSW